MFDSNSFKPPLLSEQKLPVDQSMELLQAVLNYDTKDPLILSCVLTNISALFPFAVRRQHFLPQVLYKVSQIVVRCGALGTRGTDCTLASSTVHQQCLTSLPVCFISYFFSFSACHTFNLFLCFFLLLQLFKAVTFEVGQENKVSSLNTSALPPSSLITHHLRATEQ